LVRRNSGTRLLGSSVMVFYATSFRAVRRLLLVLRTATYRILQLLSFVATDIVEILRNEFGVRGRRSRIERKTNCHRVRSLEKWRRDARWRGLWQQKAQTLVMVEGPRNH
jgi:hypothetical protein